MRSSSFTQEHIFAVLNEGEAGGRIKELCHRRGISPVKSVKNWTGSAV